MSVALVRQTVIGWDVSNVKVVDVVGCAEQMRARAYRSDAGVLAGTGDESDVTDPFHRNRHSDVPIVCGVDEAYAPALSALIVSIAEQVELGHQLRVIVLHQSLCEGTRARLRCLAGKLGFSIDIRQVPMGTGHLPVSGWVSDAVYLRLAIADLLPDETVVVYLDSDMMACADPRPLLRLDLQGYPLAAVRDPRNPVVGYGIALPGWKELGLPQGREYFNSGVMVMDLPRCRDLELFERARRFLKDHPDEVLLWDQDALNLAAADRWLRLDRRWNTFAMSPLVDLPDFIHGDAEPVMPLKTLLADEPLAALIHFAGPLKPWQEHYPACELRERYRALTAWVAELTR